MSRQAVASQKSPGLEGTELGTTGEGSGQDITCFSSQTVEPQKLQKTAQHISRVQTQCISSCMWTQWEEGRERKPSPGAALCAAVDKPWDTQDAVRRVCCIHLPDSFPRFLRGMTENGC